MPDGKFLTKVRNGRASYIEATPTEIGAIDSDLIGAPDGVAPLDSSGKVPAINLPPGFVREVIEVANFAALPATGDPEVIYKTLDDSKTWMWGGTSYAQISGGLVLGETSATAYRGDRGAEAYETALLAEPGLGTPPVTSFLRSTAAGVRAWVQLVAADITDLGTVLAGYLTKNDPTFTGRLSGPLAKFGGSGGFVPSAAQPLGVRTESDNCLIRSDTGASNKTAGFLASSPNGAWQFGIRDDTNSGCPVGAWAINDATTVRVWGTAAGMWIRGSLDVNGAIAAGPIDANGAISQAGVQRITAGGGFRGIDAKMIGSGSDTFGAGPGVMLANAETGYSNACAVQLTASGGIGFWTWAGSAWRNYWTIGYLGNFRNSSWAGGGTRQLFVNNSGDFTVSGDLVTHKSATYDFTNINGGVVVHDNSDTNATLSNGRPGVMYTLWQQYLGLTIVVPTGVKLWSTGSSYEGPTTFTLGGARPIMIQCLDSANRLIPNYGE